MNAYGSRKGASDVKRPRGRPPVRDEETRRAQIISMARDTFAELGYASTTTDIVASRCEISKQTLYRLFPSKEDLFIAATMIPAEPLLDLPRPEDEDVAIEEVIARIFRIGRDAEVGARHSALIRTLMNEASEIPEAAGAMALAEIRQARNSLAAWLRDETARGTLHVDRPESCARLLMDMMFAGSNPRGGWADVRARKEHLANCVQFFLRGASRS